MRGFRFKQLNCKSNKASLSQLPSKVGQILYTKKMLIGLRKDCVDSVTASIQTD